MARLPYADARSAPSSIRETLDRYPVAALRMLAHAESAFDQWMEYSRALLGQLELDPVLREFAILEVARLRDSQYQWIQHVAIARAVGVSGAQIAAIKEGREDDERLTESESEVLRFSREVVVDGAASERSVTALADRLGPRQVVELLLVIGHWTSICILVSSMDLEPDLPSMAGAVPDTLALRHASDP
ncbi:MAG TPA: carboxymuconolactone decarboxylase family protein [Solirubrobacteraceae bacterium]|jgi:4-carboxymuconolactone decarboxylase|nr:carboxymuconolactone decarboxylase family protein [Solirubrobacteraceae bacterium]